MRIGINGLSVATGGNVTYFANLLPELGPLAAARGHAVTLYTRAGGRVAVPVGSPIREVRLSLPGLAGPQRAVWEQSVLPALALRDRLDVLYGPADNVPLAAPCATVCAFRNPNVYADIGQWPLRDRPRLRLLRRLAVASARRCARGLFVSGAARDEIAPVIGLRPEKARVVHHGLGPVFEQALAGLRPLARPYLLTVSTIYRYKNFVRLLAAFDAHVRGAGLPHALAIVGGSADPEHLAEMQATIRARGLEADVVLPGEVRYPAVGAWYRHAEAFVFPSFRETFGHPLLEAMAAGLPIAAADIPVMREVGGDVPIYFDPFSVDALGAALQTLLGPGHDERVARGRARLAEFTWRRTAEHTLAALEEAAGPR